MTGAFGRPEAEAVLYTELYDLFVFDLDGTLAETREDLAASVNYALERLGFPPRDFQEVTRFIGNGARVLLDRALGPAASPEGIEKGLRIFLEHYGEHCLERTFLYPGVEATLEGLARRGKRFTVLTNKPAAMSRKILERFGVAALFGRIDGGDSFPAKKPDPLGLREHMSLAGASPGRTLMVGDYAVDIETARAAGARSAGALWGFKPDEFDGAPPDHFLAKIEDLLGEASKG